MSDKIIYSAKSFVQGEGPEACRVVRVELAGVSRLTNKPVISDNLDFCADPHVPRPGYGDMLSQRLRSLRMTERTTVGPFGCSVFIRWLSDQEEAETAVFGAVEATLRVAVPWTVHWNTANGASESHGLKYFFRDPLVRPGHDSARFDERNKLTELGQRLQPLGNAKGLTIAGRHALVTPMRPEDHDWSKTRLEIDAEVSELVGSRSISFEKADWPKHPLAD